MSSRHPFQLLRFFHEEAPKERTQNRLPHWEQEEASYFVTFRLADSIPAERLEKLRVEKLHWLAEHPEPWDAETEIEFHQTFSRQIDQWMDQGHGTCLLRKEASRLILEGAIQHFHGDRLIVHSFVIMPNHVHLLFTPSPGYPLRELMHSIKSFSAKELNKLSGGEGKLWQADYFDRIIRDQRHLWNVIHYIRNNPKKAGLKDEQFTLFEAPYIGKRP